ncbi:MAG TPA: sulfur oxidation c-type cytochrome SoxA [Hydrogenophaga sp.]|jgi:sulfur-oxidizing protein SoxA|uniref:sulfur oxidation c-type cytochrome SoxA n=1 Tax=Hydrogenophaga TaxID=47420 RepID=UPI0008CDC359|nr:MULTISPECIES: sulfur oxidation c-type cytochrome SoxA [Hydrogenophaga]MBU4184214.1 sulfur oxidation c-type cytochrome SoxA [Gammaproteobacteria bacterium]MBW8470691.1 sulfur oxidation c-type cytochrome SoxA [Thiobacillus sp.]OGA77436.1 MAG: sulfur oxidation c-type cytochrome SoxA [Burkholderiales bacterium GWE1_65_30]OGA93863.1 MAG: sulfur oxidation c-type cytochrome SoxA [Burkholderiales bacterium GWF1_66_17]OGB32342.1 MAG: sulfur oxidation c-type cytochrome SoxA [Burkholderiales bacterium
MKQAVVYRSAFVAVALTLGAGAASAQGNAALDGIAKYREMLQDGNPAELFEMKGEELWKQKRGPKNASLEQCDLGKGPGVIKGAFVELPRYFKDTGRVQDLETRLITCMETLQGFKGEDIAKTPFGKGEKANLVAITTYVATASKGMRFNLPQATDQEKTMYEVGKRLFFQRGGPHDFACSSCHGVDGGRIRLQDLPNLTKNPGDGIGFAAWPAYRVSNSQMWSMQHRLNDCYRQQRFPEPKFGSDATIALGVYMGVNSKGAESIVPAIKR